MHGRYGWCGLLGTPRQLSPRSRPDWAASFDLEVAQFRKLDCSTPASDLLEGRVFPTPYHPRLTCVRCLVNGRLRSAIALVNDHAYGLPLAKHILIPQDLYHHYQLAESPNTKWGPRMQSSPVSHHSSQIVEGLRRPLQDLAEVGACPRIANYTFVQIVSGIIWMAPHGHSWAQMPQPLQ
jgi:hypothetical protein